MKNYCDGVCGKHQICQYLDFQRILNDLEVKLRNVDDSDVIIKATLQTAIDFYDADRSYVIEMDRELHLASNTYEHCADGVTPVIEMLQQLPFEPYPRWEDAFSKSIPLIIDDIEKLKIEFPDEYIHLKKQEISSLLAVPFFRRPTSGFLGVDNPRRYTKDTSLLFILSHVVVLELSEIRRREAVRIAQHQAVPSAPVTLQINLLGRFEIISPNGTLRDEDFSNDAGYNLLTYLILNRKKSYSIRAIAEAIWEEGEINDPYAAVKNVVYKLRNTLDYIGLRDLVVAARGTFTLNPAYRISTDTERFEEICKRIPNVTNPDMLNQLFESLIDLYKGSLLPRFDYLHWLLPRIIYYHNLYVQRMRDYLAFLYERKEYVTVQRLAAEVLSIDLYTADMHYYLIISVYMCGNKKLAALYYNQSIEYLDDERKHELEKLLGKN